MFPADDPVCFAPGYRPPWPMPAQTRKADPAWLRTVALRALSVSRHMLTVARQRNICTAVFVLAVLAFAPFAVVAQQTGIVLRAAHLFDSQTGRLLDHPVIVVRGNRIESVTFGPAKGKPDATVIDLGDSTIQPDSL